MWFLKVFVHGKRWSRCQLTRAAWRAGSTPIGFTFINKLTPDEARQDNMDITGQFCVSCDNTFPVWRPKAVEYALYEGDSPCDASKQAATRRSTFDVFSLSGASLAEAAEIAHKLLVLTQTLFKVWLESLVVDLVKGLNGKWYMLQVSLAVQACALWTKHISGQQRKCTDLTPARHDCCECLSR